MFDIKFDVTEFENKVRQLGQAHDQIPFALSLALNDAVKNAREVLVQQTWPQHVTVRNAKFINAALRTKFAKKHDLRVEIYDALGRANLIGHTEGNEKRPKSRALAIPPKGRFRRGAKGIPAGKRPRALIANTPKKALRVTPKGIFIGKGGRLQLAYAFVASARQPADVPFAADFETAMRAGVRVSFPAAMARAMRGRR